MSEKLSEDQKLIVDFVKDLSKKYDKDYFLDKSKDKEFPIEVWSDLAEYEYLGIIIPEEYGGGGFKIDDLRVFLEETSKNNLASFQFVSNLIDSIIILKHGSKDQKNKYLPEVVSGTRFSFAITEPDIGTNVSHLKTNAVKEGDNYRLNGQKKFITGAKESKYMIVVTKIVSDEKNKGIGFLLVDPKSDGVSMRPLNIGVTTPDTSIITGDSHYEVSFDNVMVSKENLIGRENMKEEDLFDIFVLWRIAIASMALGWGRNVLDIGANYAKQRVVFEDPIGAYQAIQHPMARAKSELELAALINQRAAVAYDNKEDPEVLEEFANMAKLTASEAAYKACDISMQCHGGYCFDKGYGLITVAPLIRLTRIIPISNEAILDRFGEHVLDLPKEIV